MDKERLKAQLRIDEGDRCDVYSDSRGNRTVGVGHLVTYEDTLEVGDIITEERKERMFERDVDDAIAYCSKFVTGYDELPEAVQEVLANMMFNLGWHKFGLFVKLRTAVMQHNWPRMVREMKNSLWYTQVGNRSKRLVARIENEVIHGA